MNKRYQVFLSSTYSDLKEERQSVIQTLMEMDCIPSGMELFPAADAEQWEFIKKIIDDCDYYLLVIGGRYGSTTAEGISYTEKEYDYAIQKGLKIVALLHEHPDAISAGKTDKDPVLADRLNQFREKVKQNRLIKYWKTGGELPGLVSLSLSKTIKTYPAIGWVRATSVVSTELLNEINTLRKENEELRLKINSLENGASLVDNIAPLDETTTIRLRHKPNALALWIPYKAMIAWGELFALLAPRLLEHPNDASVKALLREALLWRKGINYYSSEIDDQDFQSVKVQFKAYGLINLLYTATTNNGMALFWNLTAKGEEMMIQLGAKRTRGLPNQIRE